MRMILAAAAVAALFPSCARPDFTGEVRTIDSLLVQVDSSYARFVVVQTDSLQAMIDSVEKHLEFVQQEYTGSMRRDMAEHLGNYRSIRKLLPDISERGAAVRKEWLVTHDQLLNLKTALTDGSTHDATGAELTEAYVAQLVSTEKNAASALVREMDLIAERSGTMNERFSSLYPQVRFWVDSIAAAAP